uniref:ORF 4 n=1 Tax=Synechococcus elongatus (strain ATCC 33912 / PCC 7942 / FACHB-805) TaxID=1140 RepID=Q57546_SYNE7|nr:ORF 4 [Synechococcus elongatus PCC 7942 = FACHB-805]
MGARCAIGKYALVHSMTPILTRCFCGVASGTLPIPETQIWCWIPSRFCKTRRSQSPALPTLPPSERRDTTHVALGTG